MYIKQVELCDFRNYRSEKIRFQGGINIIAGDNAQGKTNLLESIYILSLGKSFRSNRDAEMIRFGCENGRVKALYEKEGHERTIEINLGIREKKIEIDRIPVERNSELLDNVYTVVFSPEDLKIVKDEPEKRRRFLDRELCQMKPVYYRNLGRYKKILAHRNVLLKKGVTNREMMDVWDQALAETGGSIMEERVQFVNQLNLVSADIHRGITENREQLELVYEPSFDMEENQKIEDIRGALFERLKEDREKDCFRGNTGSGPHKDDMRISIGGMDARRYASQGQQRTAALAMKLAEVELIRKEKREDPILLLDDVLSELDERRQHDLIAGLAGVQLFLTTAELNASLLSKFDDYKVYLIQEGQVKTV